MQPQLLQQSRYYLLFALGLLLTGLTGCASRAPSPPETLFQQAAANGRLANEGFVRSNRFVQDWLAHADPQTGLIPRNLSESRDFWNASDAAADNYPFMVLTTAFTDRPLFTGRMREILTAERRLTSRLGSLPDAYAFSKDTFLRKKAEPERIIFGASEYVKDGLLPLTEWLGPSPWSSRMLELVDDIWKHAPVETSFGKIPSVSHEINGEMLQALSRIYWMTGQEKYLNWAVRLGDYYLLGDHRPTHSSEHLRLRDHGCEVVSGLTELYATLHFARPDKKNAYQQPIHEMLDRILEIGRNNDGLFYNVVNPQDGQVIDDRPADTFGYTYNGFYTVYLIDSTAAYRQATLQALNSLEENYRHFSWENGSADGDADAIESALNLYNREQLPSVARWIDREIQFMWSKQDSAHRQGSSKWQNSGIIEGWHGDGNFARTSLYYCLWKTQGLHVRPWRKDLTVGAVKDDKGRLVVALSADSTWSGHLRFDRPRHQTYMHLPLDWPRINQFPEWFSARTNRTYTIYDLSADTQRNYPGQKLQEGVKLTLQPDTEKRLVVSTP